MLEKSCYNKTSIAHHRDSRQFYVNSHDGSWLVWKMYQVVAKGILSL
jgi:hypothetical protein